MGITLWMQHQSDDTVTYSPQHKVYRIHGLFGGDFNLAVWRIFIGSPNLNHAVLTHTHKMN